MMDEQTTAILSIGSNLGDKKANLDTAIRNLNQKKEIRVTAVSSYYQTQPQNFADQDWFVNAALKIETRLSPEALLETLKRIESEMDRTGKPFRFGPRLIDLDIVYYGDEVIKTSRLEIPHPRMHERCFVLVPMCDIADEKLHPVFQLTPVEMLEKIKKKENQEVILLNKEA